MKNFTIVVLILIILGGIGFSIYNEFGRTNTIASINVGGNSFDLSQSNDGNLNLKTDILGFEVGISGNDVLNTLDAISNEVDARNKEKMKEEYEKQQRDRERTQKILEEEAFKQNLINQQEAVEAQAMVDERKFLEEKKVELLKSINMDTLSGYYIMKEPFNENYPKAFKIDDEKKLISFNYDYKYPKGKEFRAMWDTDLYEVHDNGYTIKNVGDKNGDMALSLNVEGDNIEDLELYTFNVSGDAFIGVAKDGIYYKGTEEEFIKATTSPNNLTEDVSTIKEMLLGYTDNYQVNWKKSNSTYNEPSNFGFVGQTDQMLVTSHGNTYKKDFVIENVSKEGNVYSFTIKTNEKILGFGDTFNFTLDEDTFVLSYEKATYWFERY